VLILVGAVMLYQFLVNKQGAAAQELDITALREKIEKRQVEKLTFRQGEVVAVDAAKTEFKTKLSNDDYRSKLMEFAGEKVEGGGARVKQIVDEPASSGLVWSVLIWWAPILLFMGIWIFMLRQMQAGGNKALSFGKSRAKLLNNQQKRVTVQGRGRR
jgi:cell division protease FtsH